MVFSQAGFEVTHGVSLADAPRVPQGFDFHYDGGLGPFQFLCNGGRRHFSQEPLKNDQLVGSPRTLVCMHIRPSRCACRFMYHRGKPVTRANARMTRPRWRRPPSECSLTYASCLGTHSYLPLRCSRRSARHLRQYFAVMDGRPFKPSSIMEPHLIHLMETTLRCWTYSQVHFRAAW